MAHTTHGPGGVLRDGLVQSALSLLLIPPKTTWLLFLRAPWQTTNSKKEKKIIMEKLKKKTHQITVLMVTCKMGSKKGQPPEAPQVTEAGGQVNCNTFIPGGRYGCRPQKMHLYKFIHLLVSFTHQVPMSLLGHCAKTPSRSS